MSELHRADSLRCWDGSASAVSRHWGTSDRDIHDASLLKVRDHVLRNLLVAKPSVATNFVDVLFLGRDRAGDLQPLVLVALPVRLHGGRRDRHLVPVMLVQSNGDENRKEISRRGCDGQLRVK